MSVWFVCFKYNLHFRCCKHHYLKCSHVYSNIIIGTITGTVAGNNITGSITGVVTGSSAVITRSKIPLREDDDLDHILNGLKNLTDALNKTVNKKRKRENLIGNEGGEGKRNIRNCVCVYRLLYICK